MCGPRIFLLWGNNAAYKWTTTVLQKAFEVMEKGQELIFRKKFKVIFSLHLPKIVKVHFTSATRQDGFYMTNPLPLNTHTFAHTRQWDKLCLATVIRWHVSCTAAANTRSAYRKQADKSTSTGTQPLLSSEAESHSPGCMFVILNMKQLHSLTQATLLLNLGFVVKKKSLSFPMFSLSWRKHLSISWWTFLLPTFFQADFCSALMARWGINWWSYTWMNKLVDQLVPEYIYI